MIITITTVHDCTQYNLGWTALVCPQTLASCKGAILDSRRSKWRSIDESLASLAPAMLERAPFCRASASCSTSGRCA